MQPSRPLWESQANLMAADTTLLAAATAMHLKLVASNFTPSLDLDITTLTFATFTGSTPIDMVTGAQIVYYDVTDGLLTILLKSPSGGLHWVCTATPSAAETIFGVILTDTAETTLLGSVKFDNPVSISHSGQGIDLPDLTLKFSIGYPN